jgi:hypothetical protein
MIPVRVLRALLVPVRVVEDSLFQNIAGASGMIRLCKIREQKNRI